MFADLLIYTPFTRWSWLDERSSSLLVKPASSCKRGISGSSKEAY